MLVSCVKIAIHTRKNRLPYHSYILYLLGDFSPVKLDTTVIMHPNSLINVLAIVKLVVDIHRIIN